MLDVNTDHISNPTWAHLVANRFRYLLATQLLLAIAYPLMDEYFAIRFLLELVLVLGFLAGVLLAARNNIQLIISVVLALGFMLLHTAARISQEQWLTQASLVAGGLFYAYVVVMLTMSVFKPAREVTADLIYGSVSIYLIMGSMFAFIHGALEMTVPGSYNGLQSSATTTLETLSRFVYYSFVTLTTLGYGDITPASRAAGILAYMEAIAGQLYLTILVARLVGMHISRARN